MRRTGLDCKPARLSGEGRSIHSEGGATGMAEAAPPAGSPRCPAGVASDPAGSPIQVQRASLLFAGPRKHVDRYPGCQCDLLPISACSEALIDGQRPLPGMGRWHSVRRLKWRCS